MSSEMAMPGDELATSEEYIPGPGTYERNGTIYAAVMGRPEFNEADKIVRIASLKRDIALRAGDTVLGEIVSVTNSIASVTISAIEEKQSRWVSGESGVIHVSKVTESYTDDVRKELHTGDLVRARVIQAAPSMQLSTREHGLGVLKARCGRCRSTLLNRDGKLYCTDCERTEHRKLARDFGMYTPEYRE